MTFKKLFKVLYINLIFILLTGLTAVSAPYLKIISKDNLPISYAKIHVIGSGKQYFTNSQGLSDLKGLSGEQHLTLNQLGFLKIDTLINIIDNSDTMLIYLNELNYITDKVVITGTRTAKEIELLPVPTDVVMAKEIEQQSSPRLTNILEDLAGMNIVQTPGKGVQTQGLNPDYTLILINGEPMIGRTRGILDLERFSVGNVSRVEIVKGPSSSLYGSNALAGVINIITEKPVHSSNIRLNSRYASFNTLDLGANAEFSFNEDKSGINLFVNRYSTDGYSLEPNSVSKTIPEIVDYTASTELFHNLSKSTSLRLNGRFNFNQQFNQFEIIDDGKKLINETIDLYDINIGASLKHNYSPTSTIIWKAYYINYINNTADLIEQSGELFSKSDVQEKLIKAEFQLNKVIGNSHLVTFGSGYNHEIITAERVVGGNHSADLFYAFIQEDYTLSDVSNIIASIRYDKHSDYSYSLNPKVAASYNFLKNLSIRASVGTGFKAPNSENLYLDWSNPQYGYKVYGSTYIKKALELLDKQGRIQSYLKDMNSFTDLNPEKSWSVDFGFTYSISDKFDAKFNFYRNNLFSMIDLQPVAQEMNGQYIYTYYNLNSVYTQGFEAKFRLRLIENLFLDLNYNYLSTADTDVLDDIEAGKIAKLNQYGVKRAVWLSEYGGLFFRSAHSGSAKMTYNVPSIAFTAVLRANFRSRYGFADLNSNLILDDESEYVSGYSIWSFTLNKDLFKYVTIQTGIENVFDKKGTKFLSTTPGRTYFINILFKFINS